MDCEEVRAHHGSQLCDGGETREKASTEGPQSVSLEFFSHTKVTGMGESLRSHTNVRVSMPHADSPFPLVRSGRFICPQLEKQPLLGAPPRASLIGAGEKGPKDPSGV